MLAEFAIQAPFVHWIFAADVQALSADQRCLSADAESDAASLTQNLYAYNSAFVAPGNSSSSAPQGPIDLARDPRLHFLWMVVRFTDVRALLQGRQPRDGKRPGAQQA